ncbi:hypothetical protein D3C80_1321130 [compost metagenome]
MNEGCTRGQRAWHGYHAFCFRLFQILPARWLHGGSSVVHDAGGDELGGIVEAISIIQRGVEIGGFRRLVSHQLPSLLHALQSNSVRNQQNVSNRITGFDFSHQLCHDLWRTVTNPLNVEARIGSLEAIDSGLRIFIWLAGVEHQISSVGAANKHAKRNESSESGKKGFHGSIPVMRWPR